MARNNKRNNLFSELKRLDQKSEVSVDNINSNLADNIDSKPFEIMCKDLDTVSDDIVCNLKSEIQRLTLENSELTEKLAAYIENKLTIDNNNNLTEISAELDKIKIEKNALEIENNSQLMKISELTIENKKLISQIQEIQNELSKRNSIKSNQKQKNTISNYVSYNKLNNYKYGYSSWN